MNKTRFDCFPVLMRQNIQQLKKALTEEEYHKELLNLKNQALRLTEEINQELSNQKERTQSPVFPKREVPKRETTPRKLSSSDEEEVGLGNVNFCPSSPKKTDSGLIWNALTSSRLEVKSDQKLKCKDCNSTICRCSDSACHCPYCEGITTINGRNYCYKKQNHLNKNLLSQRE